MRTLMKRCLACLGLMLSAAPVVAGVDSAVLESSFVNPPESERPLTMWHWMNGNISKAGITKDFEAMKQAGVGGVMLFDVQGGPAGKVGFFNDEWRGMIRHSVNEADRLGLKFTMHNEGGWCASGGPWVTPKDSMKIVVSSETRLEGGKPSKVRLPQPQRNLGYYQDIAVLAFPTPRSERLATSADVAEVRSCIPGLTKEMLFDNDPTTTATLPLQAEGRPAFFDIVFKEPFTAQSLVLRPPVDGVAIEDRAVFGLSVSDDGKRFKPLKTSFRSFVFDTPGFELYSRPLLASFPEVTARIFRFEVKSVKTPKVRIADLQLSSGYRVRSLPQLTHLDMWWSGSGMEIPQTGLQDAAINPATIVNLTGKMDESGTLNWDAPKGHWTIIRIGYTPIGTCNSAARGGGVGLEVDKLSAESIDIFWRGFLGKLFEDNKPSLGKSFAAIELDSWEKGGLNWTALFPQEFKQRRGYDLTSYLPVLAGYVVGDLETTSRFLWDFRRTISDTFRERYPGHMRELANRDGVKLYSEHYDNPSDPLDGGSVVDVPMGEFWLSEGVPGHAQTRSWTCKTAADAAHVYGKQKVAAEAFTSSEFESGWSDHPFTYKVLGDYLFTRGVNEFVFHRFVHQSFEGVKPGEVMAHWGSHFDRNNTWWPYASGYMTYLARCQGLLRQGIFIGDLAYYTGENVPYRHVSESILNPEPPAGHDYVAVSRNGLLEKAVVEGGCLSLGGCRYSVLVLPQTDRMTLQVLEKLAALIKEGATVYGPKPLRSPSLEGGLETDAKIKKLADEIWGACDGKTVTENRYGKGRVVWGIPLEKAIGQPPDFTVRTHMKAEVNFIHRRIGTTELFFVANRSLFATMAECTFRVVGMEPELWNPETGKIERLAAYKAGNEGTSLTLELAPAGSVFVVFRKKVEANEALDVKFEEKSPRPAPQPLTSRLAIQKATYTNPGGKSIDASREVASFVKDEKLIWDGVISMPVNPGVLGISGAKEGGVLAVDYKLDGELYRVSQKQSGLALLNIRTLRQDVPVESCRVVATKDGPRATVSVPGIISVSKNANPGKTRNKRIPVEDIPAPVELTAPWTVKFGPLGPTQSVQFDTLTSWHKSEVPDIKYYSGTALYSNSIDLPQALFGSGTQLLLDLGDVREIASLKINGKEAGILWKPPYRVDATALLHPGRNQLEIAVINVWVNRLIGDEQFPRDYKVGPETFPIVSEWPKWLIEGTPRPEPRRKAFTTYHIYKADSPLRPSGLLGPVRIIPVRTVDLDVW